MNILEQAWAPQGATLWSEFIHTEQDITSEQALNESKLQVFVHSEEIDKW